MLKPWQAALEASSFEQPNFKQNTQGSIIANTLASSSGSLKPAALKFFIFEDTAQGTRGNIAVNPLASSSGSLQPAFKRLLFKDPT